MDSSGSNDQHNESSDVDAESAEGSVSCDAPDTSDDTVKDAPTDRVQADQSESNVSLLDAGQEISSQNVSHNRSDLASPSHHRVSSELQQEHMFGNNSSDIHVYGSGDLDLEQFYRLSAQRFSGPPGLSQEGHYDDLPLAFSFPNCEDSSSKVYSCNICNFKTAFKNSLVNHQAVHSDARPWICEICDYAAKRKQDLKKHLQTMHGMIVDSLSLKPGINPATSSASSSGLASPVETKPVIVNSVAVSGDHESSALAGFSSQHAVNSAPLLAQKHVLEVFGQPLPSTANMGPSSRSLPVPFVSKFIADQFPFNQSSVERMSKRGLPCISTDAHSSYMRSGLKLEAKSSRCEEETSSLDKFSLQSFYMRKGSVGHHKTLSQREEKEMDNLSCSMNEHDNSRISEARAKTSRLTKCEFVHRPDVLDPPSRISSQSEEIALAQRRKRLSLDSVIDRSSGFDHSVSSAKLARFQSPISDHEHSPQVSSQSDHSGGAEPISSTLSHSQALETDRSFHCTHCDILFFENALYLMHMGLHDSRNPWKCSICGRTFFEKYSFTSHFINQH